MGRKLRSLALLATAALVLVSVVHAAGAERVPLSLVHTDFVAGEPERMWVDDAGVLHVRGLPYRFDDVHGTLAGRQFGVFNFDVDLATGDGHGFGTFVLENGRSRYESTETRVGSFSGRFSGQIDGGLFCGQFGGPGTFDLEGVHLRGTFCETGPGTDTYVTTGVLVDTGAGGDRPKKKR